MLNCTALLKIAVKAITFSLIFLVYPARLVFGAPEVPPIKWERIANDLELAKVELWPGVVLSPELLFLRTSLTEYRMAVVPASNLGLRNANVKKLCIKSRALFGINANFFDEKGQPLGLVVSKGFVVRPVHRGGKTLTGIFQITRNSKNIIHRSEFNPHSVLEAVQSGPRLLVGRIPTLLRKDPKVYSRRSGVCIDGKGKVLFFITSGLMGNTMTQLQEILRLRQIDCVDALNLDGGGSAQLYLSKNLPGAVTGFQEIIIHGADNIPVILGLFKR